MNWIEHHGIETLLIYALYSAIVGGMPTPGDASGVMYRWTFGTLNLLSASFARIVATQFPASKVGQALQGAQPVQPVVVAEVNPPKPDK